MIFRLWTGLGWATRLWHVTSVIELHLWRRAYVVNKSNHGLVAVMLAATFG